MKKNNNSYNGGIGVLDALLLIFIVLKLCGVITWNWFWVCSPIYIEIIFGFIIFLIIKISNRR